MGVMINRTTILVIIGVVVLGLLAFFVFHTNNPTPTTNSMLTIKQVAIGDTQVEVEVAQTEAELEQGLSGRSGLAEGTGMLFVFQQRGDWGIWMKDMQFPIDIVFMTKTADGEASVVSVVKNVSPDTYKENPPEIFYPPLAVDLVMELPAGFADAHQINQDTKVTY